MCVINPSPQAASTPLSPLTFQCEFIKLRIDTLQALSQLICTCNSLKTSPPPAIATTIALTSGNDLQRCGRISLQVKCWSLFFNEFSSLCLIMLIMFSSLFLDEGVHGWVQKSCCSLRRFTPVVIWCWLCHPSQCGIVSSYIQEFSFVSAVLCAVI